MHQDHEEFLDEVISKVTAQSAESKTKKSRKEIEASTIKALMETTQLSQKEIKKLMEDVRRREKHKEHLINQKKQKQKKKKAMFFKLLAAIVVSLIIICALLFSLTLFKAPVKIELKPSTAVKTENKDKDNNEKAEKSEKVFNTAKYDNYQLLMNAIKGNKVSLVSHLIETKNIPLYLYATDKPENNDVFYESTLINNRMLKTILKHGADPFYNFNNYQMAVDQAYKDNNDAFFVIVFNHMSKLDSTPTAIKQLWLEKIPYTSLAAQQLYSEQNFETLTNFNLANKGKYSHNWFEPILLDVLQKNDIDAANELFKILITNEKNATKRTLISQFVQTVTVENKNKEIVAIFLQ
ncbi:MAG: hypothetical protein HRU38_17340 [Saccharospirillaceae bacterium]|nr:hypothetical protein [Pseudomonadales bacterium]NRB80403.1 hypothetical protein [Saccharospirillaceae bacterium]